MIVNILNISIPLIIASCGCLIADKSGHLNIAAEGLILAGAYTGYLIAGTTGSILLGSMGGLLAGALFALLMAIFVLYAHSDVFISGLALNLLIPALIGTHQQILFANKGVVILETAPDLSSIFSSSIFLPLAFLLVLITEFVLKGTPLGLKIRTCGINPQFAFNRRIPVKKIQLLTLTLSGAFCGLAGVTLSLRLGAYVPNMSGGRGWIAVVAIYLGKKNPILTAAACIIFAIAETFSIKLQNLAGITPTLADSLPYLLTLIALIIYNLVFRKKGLKPIIKTM